MKRFPMPDEIKRSFDPGDEQEVEQGEETATETATETEEAKAGE